jgi:glycosyltransferase involved in cell wall biosynthesis
MSHAKPPRVGYVVKRYPRYSETFIVNEILAHEAAGWDLEIFALRPPVDTHFQDVLARVRAPVTYLPGSGLKATDFWQSLEAASAELPGLWAKLEAARGEAPRDVHAAVHLARAARLRGLTHLHAHFASSATSVARMAAHFADLPYSFTAHAKDIFHESVNPDELRRKLREAAAVVTVSDFNLTFLRERYGVDAHRVARIYNGLDLDRFPFSAPGERPPEIIAVGRLVEKKGFSDLIEACAHLRDRGTPFSCRIIGGGELEADLRARIERFGLGAHVCLSGPRPQREVIERLRRAAVFAAPCVVGRDGNRDGLPTVLLEAMALGTPCVSTDVTGIPEVLRDGETGLQVPQRAPGALADALARLLTDAALRIRLATAARRLIETSFDVHRNATQLRTLFTHRTASGYVRLTHLLAEVQ